MGEKHPLIELAIEVAGGSQTELARRIKRSQSAVSRLLLREVEISAETAVEIEHATGAAVPRWKLRPDLWAPPAPPTQQLAAETI